MLGIDITETVQGMIDMLGALIAGADWHALGEGIGQLLSNIDFESIWSGLTGAGHGILSGLGELWSGFSGTAPEGLVEWLEPFAETFRRLPEYIDAIVTALQGLWEALVGEGFDTDKILDWIASLPEKIDAVIDAVVTLSEVLEPVVELIGNLLGDYAEAVGDSIHPQGSTTQERSARRIRGTANRDAGIGALIGSAATGGSWWGGAWGADIGLRVGTLTSAYNELSDAAERAWGRLTGESTKDPEGGKFARVTDSVNATTNSFKTLAGQVDLTKATLNFTSVEESLRTTAESAKSSLSVIPDKFTEIKSVADTQSGDMKTKFTTAFDTIKQSSDDSSKVVSDSFTTASDNIKTSFIGAWDEIKASISEGGDLFTALSDGLGNTMKAMLNAMIQGINISITKPLQDISSSFNVLRSLDVNGSKPFATIPVLRVPPIPYLAQGAVIPPNKEFMAVLGDQSHGTNIEAPLDTIRQAVGEEFAPYFEQMIQATLQVVQAVNNKNLVIGDREIGKANARYESQQALIRGTML
jgi:hypothetical protein